MTTDHEHEEEREPVFDEVCDRLNNEIEALIAAMRSRYRVAAEVFIGKGVESKQGRTIKLAWRKRKNDWTLEVAEYDILRGEEHDPMPLLSAPIDIRSAATLRFEDLIVECRKAMLGRAIDVQRSAKRVAAITANLTAEDPS